MSMADSVGLSFDPLSFGGSEHYRSAIAVEALSGQYGDPSSVGLSSRPRQYQGGILNMSVDSGHLFGRKLYVDKFFPPASLQPPSSGPTLSTPMSNRTDDNQDVIPTALVIKNIPFSVKREGLLAVIESLGLPKPYALNYHFDNGVFRGLAFANFRTSDETDVVAQTLNGFDILGRKLRIEYKKILPQSEREKKEAEKLVQQNPVELEWRNRADANVNVDGEFRSMQRRSDDKTMTTDQKWYERRENQSAGSGFSSSPPKSLATPPLSRKNSANLRDLQTTQGAQDQLDMNDPETLKLYEIVVLFNSDKFRNELVFPPKLSTRHRRIVQMIAEKFGLFHYSQGEGDERRLKIVRKLAEPSAEVKSVTRATRSYSHASAPKPNLFQLGSDNSSRSSNFFANSAAPRSAFRKPPVFTDSNLGIIFPIRQPKGPDPASNFANRKPSSRSLFSSGSTDGGSNSSSDESSGDRLKANSSSKPPSNLHLLPTNVTCGRQRAATIETCSPTNFGTF